MVERRRDFWTSIALALGTLGSYLFAVWMLFN